MVSIKSRGIILLVVHEKKKITFSALTSDFALAGCLTGAKSFLVQWIRWIFHSFFDGDDDDESLLEELKIEPGLKMTKTNHSFRKPSKWIWNGIEKLNSPKPPKKKEKQFLDWWRSGRTTNHKPKIKNQKSNKKGEEEETDRVKEKSWVKPFRKWIDYCHHDDFEVQKKMEMADQGARKAEKEKERERERERRPPFISTILTQSLLLFLFQKYYKTNK